jgi:DNA replication protein DnaC
LNSLCAAGPPAAARCSKQAVWQLWVDRRVLIGQEIRSLNFLPAWHSFLGNKGLVTALLSRLRHQCHTVKIDGPSLRDPQS